MKCETKTLLIKKKIFINIKHSRVGCRQSECSTILFSQLLNTLLVLCACKAMNITTRFGVTANKTDLCRLKKTLLILSKIPLRFGKWSTIKRLVGREQGSQRKCLLLSYLLAAFFGIGNCSDMVDLWRSSSQSHRKVKIEKNNFVEEENNLDSFT